MRLWKQNKRGLICSIIAILLLIGCITMACLMHISRVKTDNEIYAGAQPALHIADSHAAHIWNIADTSQLPLDSLYSITDIPLPNLHKKHKSHPSTSSYIVALYPDSSWAVWTSLHPNNTALIIQHFRNSISNGYTPIKEENENGTIYHFTTHDNQFLHLYICPGIIGYSFREALLTQPSNDSALQQLIEETSAIARNRLFIFHNNRWVCNEQPHKLPTDSTSIQ